MSHNDRYILLHRIVVPEPDPLKWGVWFETHNRHVADTRIGPIRISTVFLGIDHSFGRGLPILFETMIFRGGEGDETHRYETWEQAEKGHAEAVAKVRAEIRAKAES